MRKYGLLILVFLVCIILNYNPQLLFHHLYQHWGWNLSLLASILIIFIIRYRDPIDWKQKLGINFKRSDLLVFFITTIALLITSYFLVDLVSNNKGYSFKPKLIYYKDYVSPDFPFLPILGAYIYYIPETFNEEILIGALLLMGLERSFKKLNKNIIVIGIALIFSFMHQALYRWSPVQPGILLTFTTIACLFFVGLLRNVLILKTRKIAYAWAIHLSFNLIFFSGFFVSITNNRIAMEPEEFNIVFDNLSMPIITGSLALGSLIWLNINELRKRKFLNYV